MHLRIGLALVLALLLLGEAPASAARKGKKKKPEADPYAEFVWPPPPAVARIKLQAVIRGRADVEPKSGFARRLLGASPQSPYDSLVKPFAVAFDGEGRILVTDSGTRALIRFDIDERRMDVLGTRGNVRLKLPLGLHVAPDGTIYVADAGLAAIVAFDAEGRVKSVIGGGELTNPTDSVLSADGTKLYVADSKAHQIVVFDPTSGRKISTLGRPGDEEGEFGFPTSLALGPDGTLYVVDQINSRVQLFSEDGEYVDQLGGLGVGFGNLVRPKDVAVDEVGFIYVTDNAFNNLQLFDVDFTLLTFVGSGGTQTGQFHGASGVAVSGQRFAVVDQLGRRVQLFRFLVPKEEEPRPSVAAAPEARPSTPEREDVARTAAEAEPRPARDEVERASPALETPQPSAPSPAVEPDAVIAEVEEAIPTEPTLPAPTLEPEVPDAEVPEPEAQPAEAEKAVPTLPTPSSPPTVEDEATATEAPTPPTTKGDAVPTAVAHAVEIGSMVRAWAAAWSDQDVARYLAFYSDEFRPEAMSREAWLEQRRQRLAGPAFIEVSVTDLRIDMVDPTKAIAAFEQAYTSSTYRDRVRKVLELQLRDSEWRIIREGALEQ